MVVLGNSPWRSDEETRPTWLIAGDLDHLLPKFEHIFVAVITFPLFFCTDTFYTSLLLIVFAFR